MAFANLQQTTLDLAGAAGAKTTSHDPVGPARFIVVALVLGPEDRSVSAVSFGGIALAKDADARYGWFTYGDVRSQVWSYLGPVPAGAATFSVTTAGGSVTAGRAVIFTGTADGMLTKADVATASGLNTTSGKVTLDSGADAGIGFVATGSSSAISSGVGATVVDVALTADGNSHGGIGHESPFTSSGVRDVGFFGGMVTAGNSVGLMLAETDVVFTPARLGLEAGVAPGLALVIGADRMLLPSPRIGVVAGIASGLRLEVEGPRQVMLAGGPETSALTEGGAEGQVLTYHARRRPTWEDPGGGGLSVECEVFTTSGSWSKPTDPAFSHIVVEVQGGGGGGGGVAGTGANASSVSGGGGGGGYARKLIAASDLSGSYTVTVGAGGTRGAAGNNNGNDGGASSFTGSGITTVVGNGGKGGEGDGGGTGYNIHDGGDGGTASGGDIDRAGDGGGNAVRTSFAGVTGSRPSFHAHGGGSFLGGMRRQPDLDAAGAAGRPYGGGGTGCSLNASTTGKAGGDGAAGVVIVTEYYLGVAA